MLRHSGVFVCALIKHGHNDKEMTLLGQGKATSASITTSATATAPGGLRAFIHLREEVLTAHLEARLNQGSALVSSPEHDPLNVPGTEVSEDRLQHLERIVAVQDVLNGRELDGPLLAVDPQLISSNLLRVTVARSDLICCGFCGS